MYTINIYTLTFYIFRYIKVTSFLKRTSISMGSPDPPFSSQSNVERGKKYSF